MKDIIITVGLILLGVVVFTLIMGNASDTSLLNVTKDFFTNMATKFDGLGAGAGFQ